MLAIEKNKNSGKHWVSQGQNKIFSEEIREFIQESRESQTLCANFEGNHERNVKWDDLTQLERLVFLMLSNGKDRASLTPQEFEETDNLTKLMTSKILNVAAKLSLTEINFKVVWLYYFDYVNEETRAMPVFKVYKRGQSLEAFYIDIAAVRYECWDHFIMFAQFPISFICVPRRGEYTFRSINGEELLDLEYICKNSEITTNFYRNIRPVSKCLISRVVLSLSPYMGPTIRVLQFVTNVAMLLNLHTIWEVKCVLVVINGVIIICRLLEMWSENRPKSELESAASDYNLVLLNKDSKKETLTWLSSRGPGDIERPQNETFTGFLKLLAESRKYALEILKYVPVLFEIFELLVQKHPAFFVKVGKWQCNVHDLIRFFENLSALLRKISGNGKEIASSPSENALSSLEKYSREKVISSLEAFPGPSTREGPSLDVAELQQRGLDFFGFRVYLLFGDEALDCGRFLQNLLKSNFTLQNGISFQEITRDGKVIGIVIPFSIRSKNFAIFALPSENLPK